MTPTPVLVTGLDNFGKEFSFHVALPANTHEIVAMDMAFAACAAMGQPHPQEIQVHI